MTEKTTSPKAASRQNQAENPKPKSVKARHPKKGSQSTEATQICDPAESLTAKQAPTLNQTRGPKKPPKTAAKEKPKKAPVSNKTADTH